METQFNSYDASHSHSLDIKNKMRSTSIADMQTSVMDTPTSIDWVAHPSSIDSKLRPDVERYTKWLLLNNALPQSEQKLQAYQDAALDVKKVKQREIRTFAPFQEHLSALKVMTPDQFTILSILVIYWGIGLFLLHLVMITITIAVITLLYICGFITSSILATNAFNSSSGEVISEDVIAELDNRGVEWPSYTILCPLFKEVAVVPQFVEAIKALNYPMDKLQVLFLTEESDKETRSALHSMLLPPCFTVLMVPKGTPQTKPRACNFGLLQAKGQFVVIFDAEDKPEPYQLKKAVLTFANHGSEVACVQAKLNFYNSGQNLLTRWFTAEYSTWFDIMLPGLQRSGFSLPLGGTSNHFRTEILRALGGWDAFNVTEDCDLGLRISQYHLKTAVLDSTTYEEATSRVKVWLFQRSRWVKGYLQTYLVHMRHPMQTLKQKRFRKFLSLQVIVGAWTVVLLINPFMWALTAIYVLFRPVQLYSLLFPPVILYMGAFCLIFGNFFYVYIHVIGCLRRKEYALIKWVLLLPLYWVMMSIAAYIAFYQLIVKPHHWEKTQHGNHLAPAAKVQSNMFLPSAENEQRIAAASMPTMRVPALISNSLFKRVVVPEHRKTATMEVSAVRQVLSIKLGQRAIRRRIHLPRIRDRWLIATLLMACIVSIASTWYVFQHHETVIYGDGLSHLIIARRVFDSATPGLAQLGGVWLPLPHLLILPFVWNDYLWATGLAGSFAGMICFLVATTYIFLAARRITHSSCAGLVGSLVFMLNPNVLYLQATPMTEPVCWATFTMACYFMLAWIQEEKTKYLVLAAVGTCLASLARYDGWTLVAVFPVIILIVGLMKRFSLRKIEGYLALFVLPSSIGVILWLIWGQIIFGDPLYFQRGAYSSQAQTNSGTLATTDSVVRHNLLGAIRIYGIDTIETVGIGVCLLTLVALFFFLLRRWKSIDTLGALAFLVPFVFYVVALYTGQVALFDNQATFYPTGVIPVGENIHLFNSRFGSEMVAPIAVFIATLVPSIFSFNIVAKLRLWIELLGYPSLILAIALQSIWIAQGGVIAIMSNTDPPFCVGSYSINVYLSQHYNGGNILQTEYPFHLSESEAGIHFNKIIWEGSSKLWYQALQHPAQSVDWVVFTPGDSVAKAIANNDPVFSHEFTLVASTPWSLQLYHKNGLPSLPTRPIPLLLQSEQHFCSLSTYRQGGG